MKPAPETRNAPRTKAPEIRREELMDAGQSLFLEKGISATSIDEIVAAAGVAKGTFYLYFSSKDKLLFSLRERFVQQYCTGLTEAVLNCRDDGWVARLQAWIEAAVNGYLDNVAVHDLVFHAFHSQEDDKAEETDPVSQTLEQLLREGERANAWILEDARLSAVMMFGALHAGIGSARMAGKPVDRKRLIAQIAAFLRASLRPAGA